MSISWQRFWGDKCIVSSVAQIGNLCKFSYLRFCKANEYFNELLCLYYKISAVLCVSMMLRNNISLYSWKFYRSIAKASHHHPHDKYVVSYINFVKFIVLRLMWLLPWSYLKNVTLKNYNLLLKTHLKQLCAWLKNSI